MIAGIMMKRKERKDNERKGIEEKEINEANEKPKENHHQAGN